MDMKSLINVYSDALGIQYDDAYNAIYKMQATSKTKRNDCDITEYECNHEGVVKFVFDDGSKARFELYAAMPIWEIPFGKTGINDQSIEKIMLRSLDFRRK